MKKKITIISISSILTTILLILLILLSIYFFGYKTTVKRGYKDFYKASEVFCKIPGLNTNYVPQAITYNEKHEIFIIAGYDSKDEPSYLYILNKEGSIIKQVSIKTKEDKYYTGHAGGVISFDDYIYVSSGKKIYTLNVNSVLDTSNHVLCDAITKVDTDGATMFVYNNYLFVTEFYEETKYITDTKHHLTTPSNEVNKAIAFGYEIDTSKPSGLKSNEPKIALSLPEKVQGIVVKNDQIFVSQSYGRYNDSYILTYNNVLKNPTTYTYTHNDLVLPLYYLDTNNLVSKLLAPSMTEGICLYNDKVVVIFESASKKYKATCKCPVDKIYILK